MASILSYSNGITSSQRKTIIMLLCASAGVRLLFLIPVVLADVPLLFDEQLYFSGPLHLNTS